LLRCPETKKWRNEILNKEGLVMNKYGGNGKVFIFANKVVVEQLLRQKYGPG
jgi:hypothetical protein